MDICMQFIKEADENINRIREIPLYESVFFEAEEVNKIEKENKEATEKSVSLLKKACDFIASLFTKIKNGIRNFIDYIKLSKDDKNKFKMFEEECKNNPEFANKKITVEDWKKIETAYDEVLKKAEEELKTSMKKKEEAKPNVMKWLQGKAESLKGIAKTATVEITISQAIKRAKKSPEEAEKMLRLIDNDMVYNEQIRKELGDRRYNKTVKQLERLSSDSKIIRFIGGCRKNKQKKHEECNKNLLSQIWDVFKLTRRIEKKNPNEAKGLTKGVMKIGLDIRKNAYQTHKELKRQNKELEKDINTTRKEKKKLKEKEREARKKRSKKDDEEYNESVDLDVLIDETFEEELKNI